MKILKKRKDGVTQGYHVLGRGHSAEVYNLGKGKYSVDDLQDVE